MALSAFSTTVRLEGRRVALAEASVSASLGYHPGPRYGASFGLGAIVGGRVDSGDGDRDVAPGLLATLSGSWLALYEAERRPFILASLSLGVSTTTAESDDGAAYRLTAGDARVGVLVGKTFGRWVPYGAARAFGGPVLWTLGGHAVNGDDAHHYTVGVGASLRLPARLDAFVELMPLGERSASTGISLSF
jgi:hypothetical protein